MARTLEYGINVNPQDPSGHPDRVADLQGVQWVRLPFMKDDLLYESLDRSFSDYDPLIDQYNQLGIRALLILNQQTFAGTGRRAPWGFGGTWPEYARDFGALAGQIAAHYKGKGVAYQIWNEGDLPPEHAHSSVPVSAQDFAPVLHEVAQAIRAADPDALIVFGGLASGAGDAVNYFNAVRSALGGQMPVDGVGVHPYGQWPSTLGRPNIPSGWFGRLDDAMNLYINGFGGLPIWITEIGISESVPIEQPYWPAIAEYMEHTCTLVERRYAQAVRALVWFAWSDSMREAGITTRSKQPKEPIYGTFFEIVRAEEPLAPEVPKDVAKGVLTPMAQNLKVRGGPSTQNAILTAVNPGDQLVVLEDWDTALAKAHSASRGWVHVRTPGGVEGWSAGWYLEPIAASSEGAPTQPEAEAAAQMLTPTAENLKVRGGPSIQNPILDVVNPGDAITPLEAWGTVQAKIGPSSREWVQVRSPGGVEGWSAGWYLAPLESMGAMAFGLGAASAPAAPRPKPAPEAVTPTASGLEMRQGAGLHFPVLTTVAPGDKLMLLESWASTSGKLGNASQWVNVRTPDGIEGWAVACYLTPLPAGPVVTPAMPHLDVRQGPEVDFPALAMVEPGDELPVVEDWDIAVTKLGRAGRWLNICTPAGIEGWVPGDKVTQPAAESFAPAGEPSEDMGAMSFGVAAAAAPVLTSTAQDLKVRQGPSTQYPILDMVDPGDHVVVREAWSTASAKLGQNGQWIQVRSPRSIDGWTAAWYLTILQDAEPEDAPPPSTTPDTPAEAVDVEENVLVPTANQLKVRQGPGTSHAIVDAVDPDDRLVVLEDYAGALAKLGKQGQWVRVRSPDGTEGWTAAWYLAQPGAPGLYPAPMSSYTWIRGYTHGMHEGWDIAKAGEPVYCGPSGGHVVRAFRCAKCTPGRPSVQDHGLQVGDPAIYSDEGWGWGYGHHVIVRYDHDALPAATQQALAAQGLAGAYVFCVYAHLASMAVSAGQTLAGKAQIGVCGNSGNSTGPHLHLEMRAGHDPDMGRWMGNTVLDPSILFSR